MKSDTENIVRRKSFQFAKRIVKLFAYLKKKKCPSPLSHQLIRSGTSIGANIEEAIATQSDKDFLHKLMIARKETRETLYWIKLMHETDFLSSKEFKSISIDCDEILRILAAIIKTLQEKQKQ